MDAENISRRGNGVSLVLYIVKQYGSVTLAAAILALMAANLSATSIMRTALEDLLATGLVQAAPQSATTEWEDENGIRHTIETPRMPNEGDSVLAARHGDAVRAFIEAFPVD